MNYKSIITIVLVVIAILYLTGTTITFNPFRIKMPNFLSFLGYFIVGFGIGIIVVDSKSKSLKKGILKGQNQVLERMTDQYYFIGKDSMKTKDESMDTKKED